MSLVKRDSYITIQGWMLTELNLKGSELLIYACIYGFSQDGSSKYTGSAQYLADWTNTTKKSVFQVLKSLTERGLILRDEETRNNITFPTYRCNMSLVGGREESSLVGKSEVMGREESSLGGQESSLGVGKKVPQGREESSPNNIENSNRNINIADNLEKKSRFSPPSVEEVRSYCQERGNRVDPEAFVDFYSSKGWKVGSQPMKDWKAAVRTWERRDSAGNCGKRPADIPSYDQYMQ